MLGRFVSLGIFCLVAIAAIPGVSSAQPFDVTDLGTLGGNFSTGFGINALGQSVGASYTGGNSAYHAFVYSNGAMKDLGTVAGKGTSEAWAINDKGQVAMASTTTDGLYRAYIVGTIDGKWTALKTLGGASSAPWDINNNRQVTGAADTLFDAAYHAFFYPGFGRLRDLGTLGGSSSVGLGLNNLGRVVGGAHTAGDAGYHAFTWIGGAMTDLGTLGGTTSEAWDVNDNNEIVGYSYLSPTSQAYRAFRATPAAGSMTSLGTLGGSFSAAFGINNNGDIVGASTTAGDAEYHAFLYRNGQMIDINPAGWSETEARGINSSGQIIGRGYNPQGLFHAFLLTPVPSAAAAPTPAVTQNKAPRQPYQPTLMERRSAIKKQIGN
jgi:probable HAF family extracellular repeat protein